MTAAPRPNWRQAVSRSRVLWVKRRDLISQNGTYNSQNVSEASSVNYGVLGSSDFTATGGTLWSNYSLSETALTGAGSIISKTLTATAASTSRTYDGTAPRPNWRRWHHAQRLCG